MRSTSRQAGNNNLSRSAASLFDGDENNDRGLGGSGSSRSTSRGRSASRGKRQPSVHTSNMRRDVVVAFSPNEKNNDPLVGLLVRKPPPPPPPQPSRGRYNAMNLNPVPPPVRNNRSRPSPPVKSASFSSRGNNRLGEESYSDEHESIKSPSSRRRTAPPPRTSNGSGRNQNISDGPPISLKQQLRGSASSRSSTIKSSFEDKEDSDFTPSRRSFIGGERKGISSLRSSSQGGEISSKNTKSIDSLLMMSKVESALRQIKARNPPQPNRDIVRPAIDAAADVLPTASPPSQKTASNPPSPKHHQSRPKVGNDWQQYLTKSKRGTSRRRQSNRSNSPEQKRDISRGRRASNTGRNRSRGRSPSAGRNQIKGSMNDDNRMLELEGLSEKNWQHYLTKGKRSTSRRRGSSRSNSPERDISRGRRTSSTERNRSRGRSRSAKRKLFGRAPEKIDCNDRQINNVVTNMPFTDTFGDAGIYTGQVNDDGRPNGKGSMKYNNGIFYEGTWTDGSQDEKAATQYDRVRSGFTSWGGKGKVAVKSGKTLPWNAHRKDKHDENDKMNVRGMEWVDLNGDAGRYTGEVNNDNTPHGKGIMKFDFGLIAEGEWVHGVLKENPHDRALSAAELNARGQGADAVSVMGSVRSLGRGGGMSVGTGKTSDGSMMRPLSVGPGISVGQGSVYSNIIPQTQMMIQPQPQMVMVQPHHNMIMMQSQLPTMAVMPRPNNVASQQDAALVAHQNAMMQTMYGGAYPPMAQVPVLQQHQISMQDDPPISEIKFS